MQGRFRHLRLIQIFMLFHVVSSVLPSMAAFLTIFLLAENLQQPIRVFEIGGYWSCHGEQNPGHHMGDHKNLDQKHVSKVTLHLKLWRVKWQCDSDHTCSFAQISLKGVHHRYVDIFHTNKYLKLNFTPYCCELFLPHEIRITYPQPDNIKGEVTWGYLALIGVVKLLPSPIL